MADTMTPEQRHRCMAAIRSKDTKPEVMVRRYLFGRGLRFRIHAGNLPGHPDIVFPKYKTVVFVNGCFWHGHDRCRYSRLPASNTDFWRAKIARNRERDAAQEKELTAMGWRVVRVWECALKRASERPGRLSRLYAEITDPISIPGHTDAPDVAAEPEPEYGS